MKKWLMAAAVAVAGLAGADARAQAPAYVQGQGSCANGDCGGGAPAYQGHGYPISQHFSQKPYWTHSLFGNPYLSASNNITRMPTLPVFMAAPWYNYWP